MATTKLNPFDEYQKVIDALFGAGVVRINPSVVSNNAIGTWRHADEFEMFKNNYTNKLQRLKDLYAGTKECGIIQNLAASIADEKNWEGAYAELVAYDILNTDYNAPLKLDNTRKASFAIAGKMGMKNINYDIYMPDYGVYMDVKAFTDTVGDILNHSVIQHVLRSPEFAPYRINILPEHPLDEDNNKYTLNVGALQTELSNKLREMIATNSKRMSFASQIVQQLRFNVLRDGGVNSSESTYSPYRHAEAMKDFIIRRYSNKLPITRPFFLVFVNFPWYNQITNDAFGNNKIFYRSLARRTFIQYKNDTILASSINGKIGDKSRAKNIIQKLSGIIFIDDHSITENSYNAYIYTNPNAKNKCRRLDSYFYEVLRKAKDGEFDDFQYDNY